MYFPVYLSWYIVCPSSTFRFFECEFFVGFLLQAASLSPYIFSSFLAELYGDILMHHLNIFGGLGIDYDVP